MDSTTNNHSIMDYLDQLEDMIESAKKAPFSTNISIDKDKAFDLISELRLNIPAEVRQAQRILDEYDKIMDDANAKASMILKEADNEAKLMIANHEIYKKSIEQGNEIVETAKKSAADMRLNSVEYADEILAKTEAIVKEALANINNQSKMIDSYLSQTVDILYSNRQELRG